VYSDWGLTLFSKVPPLRLAARLWDVILDRRR
jgi:hypothetical protein